MRQGLISLLGTWWRSNRGELCRELSESLEREAATSQVLGIISSSPTDLEDQTYHLLERELFCAS
jgi:hypothetical protein